VARPGGRRYELAGDGVKVVKLLRGVTLHEQIAVVERVEVDLDDICVGVVDPHTDERMGLY
jgi:hypothetical protein